MVLSDEEIKCCIDEGRIIIDPLIPEHINPNSVDLTLNENCKIYKSYNLDCRSQNEVEEFVVPKEGYILKPNTLYLYSCNEKIGVPKHEFDSYGHLAARVEGKSSLGRLGLFVHVTAGWIDAGFVGSLVLELHCVQPLKIYPNMKIAQICFYKVHGAVREHYGDKSGSKYMDQKGVQESKMYLNFNKDKKQS